MLAFTESRRIRKTYIDFETRAQCRLIWNKYIQMKKKMNNYSSTINIPCVSATGTSYITNCDLSTPCPKYPTPSLCSLATFDVEVCPPEPTPKEHYVPGYWTVNKEEGINPMNYATATVQAATTETQDQRKYLTKRLDEVYFDKERPLYAQFGLQDDDAPMTPKELKQRLADGKYVIKNLKEDEDEDDEDLFYYGGWTGMIRWRDPAKKADHDGYEAARKELRAKYQASLDTIKIDDVKAGLDAVKALEAWKPTGAAN